MGKMRKNILLYPLMLSLLFLCTGCWDNVELNEREIIVGMSIDKEVGSGDFTVGFQYLLHEKLSSTGKSPSLSEHATNVMTATEKTIPKAIRKLDQRVSRYPYFQQNRLVVIGEGAARDGTGPILDFLFRYFENRSRTYVLVAPGRALDVINWHTMVTKIPAGYIDTMITTQDRLPQHAVYDVRKFMVDLSAGVKSPATPYIELLPNPPNREETKEVRLANIAVFKRDKLAAFLSDWETRGYLWLTNNIKRGNIEADLGNNKILTHRIERSETKIEPELMQDKLRIHIEIQEEGVVEAELDSYPLSSTENIKKAEEALSQQVSAQIFSCLKKVQKELKTDVVGFGGYVERKYPKEWKTIKDRWEEIYANADISVDVKVKNRGTGLIIDPLKQREE